MIKDLKKGEWILTCLMEPVQFSHYDPVNPDDYGNVSDDWAKFDGFCTMTGSSHSQSHCSCKRVSEQYAKWFIGNKVHELFNDDWDAYEEKVKQLCKEHNIEYEGV